MCGILGMTGREEPAICRAATLSAYRGPDAFGIFSDERVTLGHNRLSIIDLDPRATQPLFDPSERIGIVYNGEIYNYKELRAQLEATGRYVFRTTSDTEVLLYAYQEWGKTFLSMLSGMFALAIYDTAEDLLLLATDHMAMKPLFYSHEAGTFFFSSELKGLLTLRAERGMQNTPCQEAIDLFLAYGYLPPPHTLFTNVYRLEEGRCLVYRFRTDTCTEETYTPYVPETSSDLTELIEERVEAHLAADVPVGVFFSGGTDSSLIVGALHARGHDLTAFSVDVEGRPEDARYFDRIAEHLGVRTHRVTFGIEEFDEVYPHVVSRLTEPFYDTSLFVTHFIARRAAQEVKVVLSGDGGDELFFGYPHSLALNRMRRRPMGHALSVFEHLFFLLPSFPGKNLVFSHLYRVAKLPAAFYLLDVSPAKDLLSKKQWRNAKRELVRRSDDPGTFDTALFLIGDLLRKTDLATMFASIEGRLPLLDPAIIHRARALRPTPEETEPKRVLKEALRTYLPSELVYRPKSGFHLPSGALFRESRYLRSDLERAFKYLSEADILSRPQRSLKELERRYPSFCFSVISLYHALSNAADT
jgi:asparagine synthase (glutamine-hydrolysing)